MTIVRTYTNNQCRDSSNYCQCEEERDHLRRATRVVAEDVMDLGLLAVPQRLLVVWCGGIGVDLDLNFKNRRVEGLGRAEGADDD